MKWKGTSERTRVLKNTSWKIISWNQLPWAKCWMLALFHFLTLRKQAISLFSILCLSFLFSSVELTSTAANGTAKRIHWQYFTFSLTYAAHWFSLSAFLLTSLYTCVRTIYVVSEFLTRPLFPTRPRWNWRLQAEIKLFLPVHRCGRLITGGHRWPQLLVPSCTTRPSSHAQAELCGGGWLGLAV